MKYSTALIFTACMLVTTTAQNDSAVTYYLGICGAAKKCISEEQGPFPEITEHEVRCCAEEKINDKFKMHPQCSVWAASKIDSGQCLSNVTHKGATIACSNIGARLCTAKELEDNCAKGTDCSFDDDIIWSSTEADAPVSTAPTPITTPSTSKSKSSAAPTSSMAPSTREASKASKKSKSSKSKKSKISKSKSSTAPTSSMAPSTRKTSKAAKKIKDSKKSKSSKSTSESTNEGPEADE